VGSENKIGNAQCSMQTTAEEDMSAGSEKLRAQLRARKKAAADGAYGRSSCTALLAACLTMSLSLSRWSLI
jgi:hypothetical protein